MIPPVNFVAPSHSGLSGLLCINSINNNKCINSNVIPPTCARQSTSVRLHKQATLSRLRMADIRVIGICAVRLSNHAMLSRLSMADLIVVAPGHGGLQSSSVAIMPSNQTNRVKSIIRSGSGQFDRQING